MVGRDPPAQAPTNTATARATTGSASARRVTVPTTWPDEEQHLRTARRHPPLPVELGRDRALVTQPPTQQPRRRDPACPQPPTGPRRHRIGTAPGSGSARRD